MGGRGASGSGTNRVTNLNKQYGGATRTIPNTPNYWGNTVLQGVYQPGYDDNGNPNVVKWQGQQEDKAANFLAKVSKLDVNQYNDGYGYYDGEYQQFSLALGLDGKPTVLSDSEFNSIVKQNNLQVLYRGESGDAAVDRFMNAEHSHTGIGSYGDGYYFSTDKSTANNYATYKGGINGRVMKMALAPNARVITYTDLRNAMNNAGSKFTKALGHAGKDNKTQYLNDGEAQFALKMGYNVVTLGTDYHYALTRDAFIMSDNIKHQY